MKVKDGLHISGKIKIDTYRSGMVEQATPILEQIRFHQRIPKPHRDTLSFLSLKKTLADIRAFYHIQTAVECPNLIMDSPNYGLDLVIQRLAGINTYSGNILWIEIGTGSTTPTVNDTALTTPSLRMAVNFQEDYATTDAIVQAYATDAQLANATYAEVGGFV
jgi:hypothetical protein